MLSEPTGVLWFVAATIMTPGVGLLLLAEYGFAPAQPVRADGLRRTARWLGLTGIILTCVLALYLLPVLLDGPRSGSLGSMGDPLGALLMLGYLFVLAPLMLIAVALIGIAYIVQRQRARSRGR